MKLTDILLKVLKEAEGDEPESDGEDFSKDASSVEDVLGRFKILRLVLTDLLTSGDSEDIKSLVDSISIVTFKPTTFKITFKNGGSMNLKYNPTPMQIDPQKKINFKPKDYFQCQIAGKRFALENRSEYLQALEYIEEILKKNPIGNGNNQTTPDTQGGDTGATQDTGGEPPEEGDDDNEG